LEADGYAWVTSEALQQDVGTKPQRYSAWFRLYLKDHWAEVAAFIGA
jgi:isopentenyldiphosphate isomerase